MQQLFILIVGHNASGKTTIAKKLEKDLQISRVGGDELRKFLDDNILYFKNTDTTYPNQRSRQMAPFLVAFRKQMITFLLRSGQSVICDGSGATKAIRQDLTEHARKSLLSVTTVLVYTDLDEAELVSRMKKRQRKDGGKWLDMYHDVRKQEFELPPHASEADIIIKYNQHNYDAVKSQLEKLLKRLSQPYSL